MKLIRQEDVAFSQYAARRCPESGGLQLMFTRRVRIDERQRPAAGAGCAGRASVATAVTIQPRAWNHW